MKIPKELFSARKVPLVALRMSAKRTSSLETPYGTKDQEGNENYPVDNFYQSGKIFRREIFSANYLWLAITLIKGFPDGYLPLDVASIHRNQWPQNV